MIPAVILIILAVIQQVIGIIPIIGGFAGLCTAIPIFLLSCVVLAWAGFNAAKGGMDIVGGAVTGIIAGVVSAIVGGVISLVLQMLGVGVNVATGGDMGGAAIGLVAGVIGIIIGVVFSLVLGAICGAIGAFVAGMKK